MSLSSEISLDWFSRSCLILFIKYDNGVISQSCGTTALLQRGYKSVYRGSTVVLLLHLMISGEIPSRPFAFLLESLPTALQNSSMIGLSTSSVIMDRRSVASGA